MVNSAHQGFFAAVGDRFGSDVDGNILRSDNNTAAHDDADGHEHDTRTGNNTHDYELPDADSLTSSLENLRVSYDHGLVQNFEHNPEDVSYAAPYFAGVRSVDSRALTVMAQSSLMSDRGANQQQQAQHHPTVVMQPIWSDFPGGPRVWDNTPYGTDSHHVGPTTLPTNGSSVLGGGAQNAWSPSGGPSQYTSSATRPSGYDQLGSFGDCSADLSSVISSFERDDQLFGDDSWRYTAPLPSIGHEAIGAQFDVGVDSFLGSVGLGAVGSQFGAGEDDNLRTKTIAGSPVGRRERRRASKKGDLKFKCPELGCGWTFGTKADLRHHAVMHTPDGGKVHACPTCSLRFRYPKDLERHDKDKHQAGAGFACPLCDSSFKRKDNLKRHQRSQRHQRSRVGAAQPAAVV